MWNIFNNNDRWVHHTSTSEGFCVQSNSSVGGSRKTFGNGVVGYSPWDVKKTPVWRWSISETCETSPLISKNIYIYIYIQSHTTLCLAVIIKNISHHIMMWNIFNNNCLTESCVTFYILYIYILIWERDFIPLHDYIKLFKLHLVRKSNMKLGENFISYMYIKDKNIFR